MSFLSGLFGKGKKIAAPSATVTAQQALDAYRSVAPGLLETDRQYLPAFAQLDTDVALGTADRMAQGELDLNRKYGGAFLDLSREMAQRADPTRFATQDALGQQILANLGMGDALSGTERQNVEQQTRAAQAARGNLFGSAPAFEEILNTDTYARQRGADRRREAFAFLGGTTPQLSPGLSFAYDAPDAGGADPMQLVGIGQGIGQQQLAAAQYNASRTNPWLQALGQIGGTYAGVKLAGAV